MGISAVSSVGKDYLSLFRASDGPAAGRRTGDASMLSRVQAVPALAGREDAEPEAMGEIAAAQGKAGPGAVGAAAPGDRGPSPGRDPGDARLARVDPRGPESILNREASGAEERLAERRSAAREAAAASGKAAASKSVEERRSAEASRKRDVSSRIEDLMGQKSAIERKQAEEKGQRSSEVVSQLAQLKTRDSEVRAHEAAHIASGGSYITGGASYTYQKGPDGAQYAVGGEVGIDASPAPGKPEDTVQKMRIVRAAALAPSEPSGADLAVAAAAAQTEASALAEIAQRNAEEAAKSYSEEGRRSAEAKDGQEPRPSGLDMVA